MSSMTYEFPESNVPLTLVEKVKEYGNLAGKSGEIKKTIDALLNWAIASVAKGEVVYFHKILKLVRVTKKERTFRNPNPDHAEKTTTKGIRYVMVASVMTAVKNAMEHLPVVDTVVASASDEEDEDEDGSDGEEKEKPKKTKAKKPKAAVKKATVKKTKAIAKDEEMDVVPPVSEDEDADAAAAPSKKTEPKEKKPKEKKKPAKVPSEIQPASDTEEPTAAAASSSKKPKGKKGGKSGKKDVEDFELKTEVYDEIGDLSDE